MTKSIKYGPASITVPAEHIVFVPYQHPAATALAGIKLGRACAQCNDVAATLYSRMPIVAVECDHTAVDAQPSSITDAAAAEQQQPKKKICLPRLPLAQDQLYLFFDMNLRYCTHTEEGTLLNGLARIDAKKHDLALAMQSASMPLLPMCTPPLYLVLMSRLSLSKGISQYAFTTSAQLFATYGLIIGLIFGHLSLRASMLAEHMLLFEEAEQLTTNDGVYDEKEE